jgi:two-component system CheB/CheR fusion protein
MEHARELPPVTRVLPGARLAEPLTLPYAQREVRGNFAAEHRQALEQAAPPSILLDEAHRILNLSESAGRFLLPPAGPISNLAPDVVRPELRLDLQAALRRAFDEREPTVTLPIPVQFNGHARQVSLHVRPILREGVAPSALVLFMEGKIVDPADAEPQTQDESASKLVAQLRSELAATQSHLRTSREQFETINEELRASNEELQSTNEEYRSTSEELETSKEELQSINEELQTLNNELKLKLDAVSRAHSDLQNLMAATDVATLFLDTGLHIHRFTPRISELFNVATGDEGRLISDFTHRLDYAGLVQDAQQIMSNLVPIERTIRTVDGRWLLMRIRPYRTMDDRIDGIVVTFVDVTEQHNAEESWEKRQRMLVGEMSHRFKNTLAVVQSIVGQSLRRRGIDEDVQRAVGDRLQALARTHNLLVASESGSAELGALARDQLAPYLAEAGRVRLEGPAVQLTADVATPFGILLHELATNAVKYGALSKPGGRVAMTWEVVEAGQGRHLELTWREQDGPVVEPPKTSGFGTTVIESALPDAQVNREFRPDGLVCTIELPLRGANGTRN